MIAKATASQTSLNQGCLCWPWCSCREQGEGAEQTGNSSPFWPQLTDPSPLQVQESNYQLQDAVGVWKGHALSLPKLGAGPTLCTALAPGTSFLLQPRTGHGATPVACLAQRQQLSAGDDKTSLAGGAAHHSQHIPAPIRAVIHEMLTWAFSYWFNWPHLHGSSSSLRR